MLRSELFAMLLLVGCAGAQSRPTADQVLVHADSTMETIEDVVRNGLRNALSQGEAECYPYERLPEQYGQCMRQKVMPWFNALEAVAAADTALLNVYRARQAGQDALSKLGCARESLATVVRMLKALKVSPPVDFLDFAVNVLNVAKGARCE